MTITRLLIVDDNEQNLYMLRTLLEGHGYRVASARDGAEALERARCDPPDMIITDILMPVMDGFALCREWKRDDRLKAIPLVFYTATYTDPKDEELALSLGAELLIVKPSEPDVLVRMLQEVIEQAEEGRLVAPREPAEEETVYFKEYNEALIRRLEAKMLQLEETNRELEFEIAERVRAEKTLQESEQNFRDLVENLMDGVAIADENAYRIYVNQRFSEITGYSIEELLNMTGWDFIRSEDLPKLEQRMKDRMAGKPVNTLYDRIIVRKDGTEVPVEMSTTVTTWRGKKRPMVIIRDITERKRVEHSLVEERNLLRTVIDNLPDNIFAKDTESRFVLGNVAVAYFMGAATPEELLGKHDSDLHPQELAEQYHADEQEVVRTGAPLINREERLMNHATGRQEWQSITKVPWRDSSGEIVGIVGIGRDITARKQAEGERELLLAQIRGQAQQLAKVMSTVPEGVLLLDAKGQVLMANPAAEGDLGVLVGAQTGDTLRPSLEQAITHLGDRPLVELLTSPPTQGLWHEVMAGNRTFEIIARPMGDGPEAEEWVLVINDVTQEREIQRRIRQQERLAAVGQLAAGIAHDFNNIMAVIVLYTQMELSMPDVPPRLRDRLETILHQANLSTELVQQILDFSRRAVLERRPMDLTLLLKEIVKLLERTVPESIEMGFTYGTDEYTVNADPTRMQQVIMNLAVNARDVMSEGGKLSITLSRVAATDEIRCVTCGEVVGEEWISIAVTDTGSGIPPDVLPHIFEPFYTTKEVGKGTGLGLAQVHGIVKQHEGHIDVTTKMEEGTTFIVYLPTLMVHEVAEPSRAVEGAPRGHGETVLVVEDNANMREAFAHILELLNYQVMIAPNGRDALNILEKYADHVALVLSDLVMPAMGGKALFYALKEQYPEIKMVMLTGHPMEQELQGLQTEGLSGYLLKPPNMEQLAQMVDRVLRGESE